MRQHAPLPRSAADMLDLRAHVWPGHSQTQVPRERQRHAAMKRSTSQGRSHGAVWKKTGRHGMADAGTRMLLAGSLARMPRMHVAVGVSHGGTSQELPDTSTPCAPGLAFSLAAASSATSSPAWLRMRMLYFD